MAVTTTAECCLDSRFVVLKFMISMCDFVGILLMDYMLKFMVTMCGLLGFY